MKKWFIVLSVSLIFVLMLSSIPASAAGPRHGAIVTQTDEAKWSGITADIVLPKTATIKNGYADWYLGLGSAVVESGISKQLLAIRSSWAPAPKAAVNIGTVNTIQVLKMVHVST